MILAGSTRGAEAIRTGAPPPSPSGADADEAGASYTQPNLGLIGGDDRFSKPLLIF